MEMAFTPLEDMLKLNEDLIRNVGLLVYMDFVRSKSLFRRSVMCSLFNFDNIKLSLISQEIN